MARTRRVLAIGHETQHQERDVAASEKSVDDAYIEISDESMALLSALSAGGTITSNGIATCADGWDLVFYMTHGEQEPLQERRDQWNLNGLICR